MSEFNNVFVFDKFDQPNIRFHQNFSVFFLFVHQVLHQHAHAYEWFDSCSKYFTMLVQNIWIFGQNMLTKLDFTGMFSGFHSFHETSTQL